MKLQIILEPSEEGGYTVTVPALPGCISEGDSLDEAVANIQEAIELYLEPDSIPDNKNLIIRELVVRVKFLALLIQKLLPLSNEMVGDLFAKKAVIFV
jgi:predicted RNase H-like HicB family nuclease